MLIDMCKLNINLALVIGRERYYASNTESLTAI